MDQQVQDAIFFLRKATLPFIYRIDYMKMFQPKLRVHFVYLTQVKQPATLGLSSTISNFLKQKTLSRVMAYSSVIFTETEKNTGFLVSMC